LRECSLRARAPPARRSYVPSNTIPSIVQVLACGYQNKCKIATQKKKLDRTARVLHFSTSESNLNISGRVRRISIDWRSVYLPLWKLPLICSKNLVVTSSMADNSRGSSLTRTSVQEAHERIRSYVHQTPVVTSSTLNSIASTPQTPSALKGTSYQGQRPATPTFSLFFKCENLQKIGAFKARFRIDTASIPGF
jgi:hypothetical protein